jgi:predicted Zn-ribbon and HTH transcriptional regulator
MSTEKPSKNEEEYFLRQDADLIKAQRAKLDAERVAAERSTHYMRCPKCGATLNEIEFSHIKVDTCPDCKGMWLDAGEIELIGRTSATATGGFIRDLFKGLRTK